MKSIYALMVAGATACLVAEAAPVSNAAREAQAKANEYKGAVVNCDMGWAVDSMYPLHKWTLADRLASRNPREERENALRISPCQCKKATFCTIAIYPKVQR